MGLIKRERDMADPRITRPAPGRHRGSRKLWRERQPAGGRHAKVLEASPTLAPPSWTR